MRKNVYTPSESECSITPSESECIIGCYSKEIISLALIYLELSNFGGTEKKRFCLDCLKSVDVLLLDCLKSMDGGCIIGLDLKGFETQKLNFIAIFLH